MTALKPIEWRHVRGVPSTSYPINTRCAHPDCTEQIDGVHHIFPRSQIGNSSYFVEFTPESGETKIIPHAIGLCGSGTTGHHGDVEEHRAWIRLEDGEFVWYARDRLKDAPPEAPDVWDRLGPLNPQPGSREGKPKRKRTVKGTQERAERKTVSLRLPEGFGGDEWDELVEATEAHLLRIEDSPFSDDGQKSAVGKVVVYGLQALLGWGG